MPLAVLNSSSLETVEDEAPICGVCQFCGNKYSQSGPISSKQALRSVYRSSGWLMFQALLVRADRNTSQRAPWLLALVEAWSRARLCSNQSTASVTGKLSERIPPGTDL